MDQGATKPPATKPRQSPHPAAGAEPLPPQSDLSIIRHVIAIIERRALSIFDIDAELGIQHGSYFAFALACPPTVGRQRGNVMPSEMRAAMVRYIQADNTARRSAETASAAPVKPDDPDRLVDDPDTAAAVLAHNRHGMRISTIARWTGLPYEVVKVIIARARESDAHP